jgi:hypothetical protein
MYDKKVNFSVTGTYGCGPDDEDDVYTVDQFINLCESNMFIDYDGYGHPVKDGLCDRHITIYPSGLHNIPLDATHIVWYNR